jgi:hypothetical protein
MSHISTSKTTATNLDVAKKALLDMFKAANGEDLTEKDLVYGKLSDDTNTFNTEFYLSKETLGTRWCGVGIGYKNQKDTTLTMFCDAGYDNARVEGYEYTTSMRELQKRFNAYYAANETLASIGESGLAAYDSVEKHLTVNEKGEFNISLAFITSDNGDTNVLTGCGV